MFRLWWHKSYLLIAAVAVSSLSQPISAQEIRATLEARDRVFPSVGAGVAALKHDSAGRYYIIAKPASAIQVYAPDGTLTGEIPNANSHGAAIKYAVDVDISPEGLVYVADRGANAVEVFQQDGSLVARISVAAPTSIAALSGGQFAVTTLTSKHLVQIRDEQGNLVRSFGGPAEQDAAMANKPLMDLGRISGDSAGHIYFAFTSAQNPTVRTYDRYGYVGYEASVPENAFAFESARPEDRAQFVMNLTRFSFSEQVASSVSVGSSGDVKLGGGVGMGLGEAMRSGGGYGRQMSSQGMMPPAGSGSFGGMGGGNLGGSFSAEITNQGSQVQLGLGTLPRFKGGRGIGSSGDSSSIFSSSQSGVLLYSNTSSYDEISFSQPDSTGALSYGGDGQGSAGNLGDGLAGNSNPGPDAVNGEDAPLGINADQGFGLPGAFVFGSMYNPLGLAPGGFHPDMHPAGMGGSGAYHFGGSSGGAPAAGMGAFGHFPGHSRFGSGETGLTAGVRLNIGDLTSGSHGKHAITAVGVDPATHEIWAGIGDSLAHFNRNGDLLEIYDLTLKGGAAFKANALLIEPDRILVGADPWGVFEFARPDKPRQPASPHISTSPAQSAASN